MGSAPINRMQPFTPPPQTSLSTWRELCSFYRGQGKCQDFILLIGALPIKFITKRFDLEPMPGVRPGAGDLTATLR
jgi:hypothetical protein